MHLVDDNIHKTWTFFRRPTGQYTYFLYLCTYWKTDNSNSHRVGQCWRMGWRWPGMYIAKTWSIIGTNTLQHSVRTTISEKSHLLNIHMYIHRSISCITYIWICMNGYSDIQHLGLEHYPNNLHLHLPLALFPMYRLWGCSPPHPPSPIHPSNPPSPLWHGRWK